MKTKKKNLAIGIAALTIAVGAAINVGITNNNENVLSGLSLNNVEALAGEYSTAYKCCKYASTDCLDTSDGTTLV